MSTGTLDLACPVGKSIQIITPTCTVSVPSQAGLGPVTYESGGGTPKDVTATAEIEGISYSGSGATCAGSFSNATLLAKITIKAYEDSSGAESNRVQLTVTG